MTTSVTRSCFTTQHQTCKTKTDFFLSQTGLVLRPTVSDHITDENKTSLADVIMIQLTLTLLDIDATQYRTSLNVRSDRRDNWPFIKRWQAVKMTKKCEDVTWNIPTCCYSCMPVIALRTSPFRIVAVDELKRTCPSDYYYYYYYYYPRRARSAIGVDTVFTLDVCLYVCMLVL